MGNKSSKTKILYIITKSVWGGAGKYVYDLATGLPRSKYEPIVAAGPTPRGMQGHGLLPRLREENIPYFKINGFQRDINPLRDVYAFFEILSLLFKTSPDVVHVSSAKAGGIAGIAIFVYKILSPKRYPLNAIYTVHGWAFLEPRPKWQIAIIKFFSKVTCLFYHKIICVSEYGCKIGLKNKITKKKKLITIHNGIKAEEYFFLSKEEVLKAFGYPKENFIIGTIGEFNKNKGQKHLIKAIEKINKKARQPISVLIIGWGEEKEKLQNQIKKAKLEKNISLVSNLPDAPRYLKALDLFILPSLKEGLPYVLLEASLARIPIIATEVGGIPEIIKDKDTGLITKPRKPEEITEGIRKIRSDKQFRSKLAQNARDQMTEKFSFEEMLKNTLKTYSR